MSVDKLSSVNQKFIITNSKSTTNEQSHVDLTTKPDTVELSKNVSLNKNKIFKIATISIAAFAAIGGAILLIKKGKTPPEIKKAQKSAESFANEAKEFAEQVQLKAEKLKQEAIELFNNNGQKDGEQVANIVINGKTIALREVAEDGSVKRISTFVDDILSNIEETTKTGVDAYSYDKKGALNVFYQGYEKLDDGTRKAATGLVFNDGKLQQYFENKESCNALKVLTMKNGKLCTYAEDAKIIYEGESGVSNATKILQFENNTPIEYLEDYDIISGHSKGFEFIDGKWKTF